VVLEAAVAAGAPADIMGWIDEPTGSLSQALMQYRDINLILATGGNEAEHTFLTHLEGIADQAFDDQCTPANPRYPLITDLKDLYTAAYQGVQLEATISAPTAQGLAIYGGSFGGSNSP